MEIFNARTRYKRALEQLEVQKKNKELSETIYNTTVIKFNEGVGSSLEVTVAENDRKTAQTNYLNAIYEYLVAKIEMDKALGNIQ